jgi:hypothetical protein
MLGPEERPWVIGDDKAFFAQVYQDAAQDPWGTPPIAHEYPDAPSHAELKVAETRARKGDLFSDRIMDTAFQLDTARSYRGYLLGKGIVQVEQSGDNPESQRARVGDSVRNVLSGFTTEWRDRQGNIASAIDTLVDEMLGNDTAMTLRMTTLSGHASVRKLDLWTSQLVTSTAGLTYLTREADQKLYNYLNRERPMQYRGKPDVRAVIDDKVTSYRKRRRYAGSAS